MKILMIFIILVIIIFAYFYNKNKQEQEKEIKKYKDLTEYLLNNKDKIILTGIRNDRAFFSIGYINLEIYLGSETFVKINGVDFGHNTELAKILEKIYYRDREDFII